MNIAATGQTTANPHIDLARERLPRLAYVADVPVAKSFAGMLILYRLFERYPREKLLILESVPSATELRLPGVRYDGAFPLLRRLMRTRFHRAVTLGTCLASGVLARVLAARMRKHTPEAIVTVSDGVSWLIAARLAARLGLPLMLVNHDSWRQTVNIPAFADRWLERQFAMVYRGARVRFCVSPEMEAHYAQRYGASGTVLYPGRGVDRRAESNTIVRQTARPFRMGFAGSLHGGFAQLLCTAAECLARVGGTLVVYSPLSADEIRRRGLTAPNVVLVGPLDNGEIVGRLSDSCDALIVPMPAAMGVNVRLSFPSKLVDYTATGLPIVIFGAPECTAGRWARLNDVGIVVDENDSAALSRAIETLAGDTVLRIQLGRKLQAAGQRYFSHEHTAGMFMQSLIT